MKQVKPIIHGRDHACGGADPIPGICDLMALVPGTFSDWVESLSCLWAYWPMQEPSGDVVDQGAFHADCQPVGSPAYQTTGPNTSDLPFAVRLTGAASTSITGDSFFNTADDIGTASYVGDLTAMCWIKPDSGSDITKILPVMATWDVFRTGWELYLLNSTRVLVWGVGNGSTADILVGPAITMDAWSLVGVTWVASSHTATLYVNGAQVATGALANGYSGNAGIRIGAMDQDNVGSDAYVFYGDMAGAVFVECALTAGDMLDAYNAGFGAAPAGTVTVDGTDYDEILTGTGLTSTDNSDGTVTLAATGGGGAVASDTIWDTKGDVAVASAANAAAVLPVGSNSQVLTADSAQTLGVKWATPAAGGGAELSYVEATSGVTVSATSEAGANTIVTAAAVTVSGSQKIKVEFYCGYVFVGAGTTSTVEFYLFDGSSSIGGLGILQPANAAQTVFPVNFSRVFTPSSGTRTYSVRAARNNANGTASAGAGGAGARMPMFIRITNA